MTAAINAGIFMAVIIALSGLAVRFGSPPIKTLGMIWAKFGVFGCLVILGLSASSILTQLAYSHGGLDMTTESVAAATFIIIMVLSWLAVRFGSPVFEILGMFSGTFGWAALLGLIFFGMLSPPPPFS